MKIEKSDIIHAAQKVGIPLSQIEQLWSTLSEKPQQESIRFDLSKLLYYLGALIILVSMGWFLGNARTYFGDGGILAISLSYLLIFLGIGHYLWQKTGYKVPGGLFITLAVCLIPIVVYSTQRWTGLWGTEPPGEYKNFFEWIRGGWFSMEIATLIGGLIALYFYRFPFLTAPIYFTLWFMSMDIAPLLIDTSSKWDDRLWISMIFGLGMLIIAYIADLICEEDYAFWGYLFGAFAFWIGLTMLDSNSELQRFIYCLINIGLIFLSVFLQRYIFLIVGVIGFITYLSSVFFRYFADTAWFPIALSLLGLLVIAVGLYVHKNREKINSWMMGLLPESARGWMPRRRS